MLVDDLGTKVLFHNRIEPLKLSVRLGVVSYRVMVLDFRVSTQGLLEVCCELGTSVANNSFGQTIMFPDMPNVELNCGFRIDFISAGYQVAEFLKSVCNHNN